MKKYLIICGTILLKLAAPAGAAVVIDDNWTTDMAIPEGNPVGITESETFQNLSSAAIADVSVNLNISGGYVGGLYAYLTLQDANGKVVSEILLNEVGTSSANPFGSSATSVNVTLSDSGTANGSLHNATGNATGTWLADSSSTLGGTFDGLTADGTWTLYVADLDTGGGTSVLNSWGLEVSVLAVPEPAGYGAVAGALVLLACARRFALHRSSCRVRI